MASTTIFPLANFCSSKSCGVISSRVPFTNCDERASNTRSALPSRFTLSSYRSGEFTSTTGHGVPSSLGGSNLLSHGEGRAIDDWYVELEDANDGGGGGGATRGFLFLLIFVMGFPEASVATTSASESVSESLTSPAARTWATSTSSREAEQKEARGRSAVMFATVDDQEAGRSSP